MVTQAVRAGAEIAALTEPGQRTWGQRLRRIAREQPLGAISLLVILVYVATALLAPVVATHEPNAIDARATYQRPNGDHLMGTDNYGRDLFSRVVYGTRISVSIGLLTVLFAAALAAAVGGTSGFLGGKIDLVGQRLVDAFQAFPALILAIIVVAVLGASWLNVIVALTLSSWPGSARVIRSQVLSLKETQFVEAARCVGATDGRILLRHLLPNVLPIILVLASASVAAVIVAEATLSFLGLGVPPPTPTWGAILTGAEKYAQRAPWIGIFPGLAITVAVFAANFLGDAVRDLRDPRLRGTR
jgi:peptide/nickel transport system permease protein